MRKLALAAGLVLLQAGPAAADDSFRAGLFPPEPSAHGSRLAWALDNGGRARFKEGFGAAARDLPIPRSFFLGFDVGTDGRGQTVLVYSACSRRRSCDTYLYRFSGRPHRIAGASSRRCDETNPQVDAGVVVFTRVPRRRRRCARGLFSKRIGGRLQRVMRRRPLHYDLSGRSLVFDRDIEPRDPNPEGYTVRTQIRLLRLGRRRSRLLVAARKNANRGGSEGPDVSRPALDGGFAYWQRVVSTFEQTEVDDVQRRRADGTGPVTTLDRTGRLWLDPMNETLDGFTVSGGQLFYAFGGFPYSIGRVTGGSTFR